jgi:hypothetical protein
MLTDHFLVTSKLNLRQIERRLGLSQRRLRCVELRLEGARIDHKEKLIFGEIVAILEVALDDAASDLRRHRNRFEGRIAADLVELSRHVLRRGFHHRDQR